MTLDDIIKGLKEFNSWRIGETEILSLTPSEITKIIEHAIIKLEKINT